MSDSEDDFMSDKFLVEEPKTSKGSTKTYGEKRHAQALKGMRSVQANNQLPLAQLEKARRYEGLNTSLFDRVEAESSTSSKRDTAAGDTGSGGIGGRPGPNANGGAPSASGGSKAMKMMMRMGWKKGEGLGKARSPSPDRSVAKRTKVSLGDEEDEDDPPQRGGIGSSSSSSSAPKRPSFLPPPWSSAGGSGAKPRTEPIRVSLWSGRKGLSARTPSPPPLTDFTSRRNPDALDEKKMKRLEHETEGFRERQRREFAEKEVERKCSRGREMLVKLDREKGVMFHALHVSPLDPLGTLPKPLLKRIYPAQAYSPSPPPPPLDGMPPRSPSPPPPGMPPLQAHAAGSSSRTGYVSQAEKMRERMRRDMLSGGELGGSDDEDDNQDDAYGRAFGVSEDVEDGHPGSKRKRTAGGAAGHEDEVNTVALSEEDLDWDAEVQGTKRVLSMEPKAYLEFLVSQLRQEHLYCLWCSYKYGSYDEMEGPGGCPGEDEDDH